MSDVLVVESRTHPVRIDTFDAASGDLTFDVLTVERGSVGADVEDEILVALEDHVGLYFRTGTASRQLFENHEPLSVVVTHGSGYDHVDLNAATEHGVAVIHSPEAPGPAVVEHTLGMMIMLLREFPARIETIRQGNWSEAQGTVPELAHQTVGIVGLGTIGLDVARGVSHLGADVLGYDPYVTGDLSSAHYPRHDRGTVESAGVKLVGTPELYEMSDVLTVHAPLTEQTRGMIGKQELAALDDGYLLNAARGEIVDESALLDTCDDLAGVALDVLSQEPPEPDNPLVKRQDVLVTPHIGASTDGYLERSAESAGRKLRTLLYGGDVDTLLNPTALSQW